MGKDTEALKDLSVKQVAEKFDLSYQKIQPFIDLMCNTVWKREWDPRIPNLVRSKHTEGLSRSAWHKQYARETKNWYFECAGIITIHEVLTQLDALYQECGPRGVREYLALVRRLVWIGFTQMDSLALPLATVSFAQLKRLPRKQLLTLDALVLGSLSHHALFQLKEHRKWVTKSDKRFTIADILGMEFEDIQRYHKGAAHTFLLLKRLGFVPKDGLFMRDDPLEKFAKELLSTEEGITLAGAKKFAAIAARRNWI
ncbi:MAG: hypothetical protein WC798_00685 [Candidatus Paceibacterota bacterium]|jgi:hypothetical protein